MYCVFAIISINVLEVLKKKKERIFLKFHSILRGISVFPDEDLTFSSTWLGLIAYTSVRSLEYDEVCGWVQLIIA